MAHRIIATMLGLAVAILAACETGETAATPAPDAGETPLASPPPTPVMSTLRYGPHPDNVGDLRIPAGVGPFPVVVLIHGGYWREPFGRDLMDALAEDLQQRGYASWNIEYRRLGAGASGGYPNTFQDVADAVQHLAELAGDWPLDLDRVAVTGHSAGGHLAAWTAGRVNLPRDAAGSLPDIRPKVAVALAGLLDLRAAFEEKLGGNAVSELVGANPDPEGRVWQRVSPIELLPTGASLLIVHGKSDFVVPQEQSEAYYRAAIASGDRAELLIIDRADHFDVIDPDSEAWQETFAALDRLLDETD